MLFRLPVFVDISPVLNTMLTRLAIVGSFVNLDNSLRISFIEEHDLLAVLIMFLLNAASDLLVRMSLNINIVMTSDVF